MQLSRFLRPAWSVAAMGLTLSLLTSPMAARADDDDDDDKDVKREGTVRIYRHDEGENAVARGGYLGVQVQDVTRALKRARDLPTDEGALVNRVESEGPASQGGLRRGDVIVEVDRKKIENSKDLIEVVRELEPGSNVKIVLWRSGSLKTVTVEVGQRPKDQPMAVPPGFGRWRAGEDGESMPPPGVSGQRTARLNERLRELQNQLQQLRDVELPRLENEIQALRRELRRSQDDDDEEEDD